MIGEYRFETRSLPGCYFIDSKGTQLLQLRDLARESRHKFGLLLAVCCRESRNDEATQRPPHGSRSEPFGSRVSGEVGGSSYARGKPPEPERNAYGELGISTARKLGVQSVECISAIRYPYLYVG